MSNDDDEEESRRRFLFRALFHSDGDHKKGQIRPHPLASASSVETCTTHEIHNRREHVGRDRRKFSKITRISQLETWDCGIACLLMIAKWLRDGRNQDGRCEDDDEDCRNARMELERTKLLSAVGTESIWTSDLMQQLQLWNTKSNTTGLLSSASFLGSGKNLNNGLFEESLAFVLASQQIMGADESYRDFQYYQNAFEEDHSRVARTFRDLGRQNIQMLQTRTKDFTKGLSLSTVIEIVERDDCLAIVLLDNAVLKATLSNTLDDGETSPRPQYAGHYVILCGTSDDPKHVEIANAGEKCCFHDYDSSGIENEEIATSQEFCFVVCNPDPSSTVMGSNYTFVTPRRLESSWRAQGTDEDIIFLRNTKFQEPVLSTELEEKGWLSDHFRLFSHFPFFRRN